MFPILFKQEGRISRLLIDKGIMYRQPCRDTGNKKEQFTYRVKNANGKVIKNREIIKRSWVTQNNKMTLMYNIIVLCIHISKILIHTIIFIEI